MSRSDARSDARTAVGPLPTGLVALLVVLVGTPAVWADLRGGAPGLESLFFPVLAVALGHLAVSRRRER